MPGPDPGPRPSLDPMPGLDPGPRPSLDPMPGLDTIPGPSPGPRYLPKPSYMKSFLFDLFQQFYHIHFSIPGTNQERRHILAKLVWNRKGPEGKMMRPKRL